MATGDGPAAQPLAGANRTGPTNPDLVVYSLSHLLAIVAEWAVFLGVLVYANEQGGATATGLASIGLLLPYVMFSPHAAALAERYSAWLVRAVGIGVQAVGYSTAAVAAWMTAPAWVVVAAVMVALAALMTLRPAGSVLMPAIVRTSRELTVANVWQGYCDSAAVLAGPLLATVLLYAGGAAAVIAGCAVCAALAGAVAVVRRPADLPPAAGGERMTGLSIVTHQVGALRSRPGVSGVLAVAAGQYLLIGGLDILLVVIAIDELDLGGSGAGVLTTAVGIGALASMLLTNRLANRSRVASVLTVGVAITAAAVLALGLSLTLAVALTMLPLIGLSRSTVDVMARLLLQRSAGPHELAAVFAVVEIASGIGLLAGSLGAQALIAVSGAQAALIGFGVVFVALALGTAVPLRRADDSADVPVVAMSLLRRVPVFAPLPHFELEAVARAACELATQPAQAIITQGEMGDDFYAVTDGQFDVTIDEQPIRTIERGGGFGEVALLADVPRTATVTSRGHGSLLVIDRATFLLAVTGYDSSRRAAWRGVATMERAVPVPDDIDSDSDEGGAGGNEAGDGEISR